MIREANKSATFPMMANTHPDETELVLSNVMYEAP
jgi:hypothetical protein